ncbi:Multicopy suppressor of stt4 mutation [Taphrina deformans PYCC 5710]|uniref:1-phosphatidylinositol-4-phosphate 5-kinase n=1 Tax=Taphrina deformans (strain PYCC 5710 / ATCC 11124 / CBS 356.35 / IMI 108563 / JCM 9778 / NBRC 8474) TaxID=1097556 RepID=R4X8N7_TAPDE|nr:Multicopy suppressor of stt4 mutation [Taphrina deformans PYCC 5710]|eukprot:CCG81999.1 Multicopy suppressor of stt4 mutation [Taphrina deformans PYCC 5710]
MDPPSTTAPATRERNNRSSMIRRSHSISSSSNARRRTRSLNSDHLMDEVPTDEDAARWAETIRQRRLSRKRRVEDEDAVLVGTRVSEGHTNWVTAYNMLTGIRVATSRCNAKMDRDLTSLDFKARHKLAFDIQGNELTPSARYDFKFKDYAPWVFRDLRKIFQIDAADYLVSLTGKYILSELGSPGKSGSFFYFSRDYRFIIKTLHHAEHKFLRRILPDYHDHTKKYPNTLISQFYGLHRVKTSFGKKIHFVVMNNLFPPHMDIHSTYDVKGSTVGRITTEDDKKGNPRGTLKDLNWLNSKQYLKFDAEKKKAFLEQVQADVELLARLQIMDYSLLLGIHNMSETTTSLPVTFSNAPEKLPKSVVPSTTPAALTRTPSVSGQNYRHRDLRRMVTPRDGPLTMAQIAVPHPTNPLTIPAPHATALPHSPSIDRTLHEAQCTPLKAILSGEAILQQSVGMQHNVFYQFEGGIRSHNVDGTPGNMIYFVGIIDLLTNYGTRKRLENIVKGFGRSDDYKKQISAVPPQCYAQRFRNFVSGMTKSPAEVEIARIERTPSAVNLEKAVKEMNREHIDSQTPEPETTLAVMHPQDHSAGDIVLPILEEAQNDSGALVDSNFDTTAEQSNHEIPVSMRRRKVSSSQKDRLQEAAGLQEARRASLDELQGTPVRRASIGSTSSEHVIEEPEVDGHDSGVATSLDCLPEESEPSRQSSLSRPSRTDTVVPARNNVEETTEVDADIAPPLEHDSSQMTLVPETRTAIVSDHQAQLLSLKNVEAHRRTVSAEERAVRRRGVVESKAGHGIYGELERRASIEHRDNSNLLLDSLEDEGYSEMSPDEAAAADL